MNGRMPGLSEADIEFVAPSSERAEQGVSENEHRLEVNASYEAMSENLRANLFLAAAELHRRRKAELPQRVTNNANTHIRDLLNPAITEMLSEVGDTITYDEVSRILQEHFNEVPVNSLPHIQAIAIFHRAYESAILDSPDAAFNHDKALAMEVALLTIDELTVSSSRGQVDVRLAINNKLNLDSGADVETLATLVKLQEELKSVPLDIDFFDLNTNEKALMHAKRLAPFVDAVVDAAQVMIGGMKTSADNYPEAVKNGGRPVMASGVDIISFRLSEFDEEQTGLPAEKSAPSGGVAGMITRANARKAWEAEKEIQARRANLDLAAAQQQVDDAAARPLREKQANIDLGRFEETRIDPSTGGRPRVVKHYGHGIEQGTGLSPAAQQKVAGEGAVERARIEFAELLRKRDEAAEAARLRRLEEDRKTLELYEKLKRKGNL